MLTDANINTVSLKEIYKNIQKHSPVPQKVKIIAITKSFSYQAIKSAEKNNIFHIGESKVQETQLKLNHHQTKTQTQIHLVGHLQSNKAALAVKIYKVIQSVDNVKILKKINTIASKENKTQQIFLQLNITKAKKQKGFQENEIFLAAEQAQKLPFIETKGIMVIGPNTKKKEIIQAAFRKTKEIQQQIQKKITSQCKQLSMGMSQDYIWALKEGTTEIRLGTILFKKTNV